MRINESKSQIIQDGKGLKISIILSRFNDSLGNTLLENTLVRLKELNVAEENIELTKVPGALELPLTAKLIATKKNPDAIIALGIVVKGETSHYEHVCNESHRGLMNVSLETETPVIFGVITALNEQQAIDRVEKNKMNKGKEYAETAIEMALLKNQLKA